jgi:hypothetical protein
VKTTESIEESKSRVPEATNEDLKSSVEDFTLCIIVSVII